MKVLLFLAAVIAVAVCQNADDFDLLVVTVATSQTDGYKRFMRSADVYGLQVKVVGMNQQWRGGDMANGPGGGQKINMLKESLMEYKDKKNTVILFTDSYDVVLTAGKLEILKKFFSFNASIVISAEDFCWPDKSLADLYPLERNGYRFLCSGGIVAYAPDFYKLVTHHKVTDRDDDQLYYTKIFLKDRDTMNIKLDHKAELMQNLNGNKDDVELRFEHDDARLYNTKFYTKPVVVHGNGPSKLVLNHLGNYLAKKWTFADGCISCDENTFNLEDLKEMPAVTMALFFEQPTPFGADFLDRISALDYPKARIDVFIHSVDPYHNQDIQRWTEQHQDEYRSIKVLGPHSFLKEAEARGKGLVHCQKVGCDYYFAVDATVTLTNPKTLRILMEQNRTFISPMVSQHGKLWSNFWGAIGSDGYYARSDDYIDIVTEVRRGLWNAPFVSQIYLMRPSIIKEIKRNPFDSMTVDPDMAFCESLRDAGVFMYVTNMQHFGHLKEIENFDTSHKNNDMYEIFNNRLDWEMKYLHTNYSKFLEESHKPVSPCPDVYWFPFTTEAFARDLIDEMENFGQWSSGGHKDERLAGGYENVPTVDIHMKQIGFERHWLHMLKQFVAPMASRLYAGFTTEAHAIMNFVVKYTPTGQYFLRPHHDASTYTINLALNRPGIDFQGGGCRFLRYNCSVTNTRVGWTLMHPGRLTHYHEGLPVYEGKRYIMVSFIDP